MFFLMEDEKVENSVHRQPTAERRTPRPWVIVAILLVLTVITSTGGTACAGSSGPDVSEMVGSSGPSVSEMVGPSGKSVSEMVWPEGIPGTTPGVKGDFELRLNIGERGDVRFRARGRAEGFGIVNHALYSMWLNNPAGDVVFIDAARASEELTANPLSGEVECVVGVDLRDDLVQAPFNATSIEDLTATIREGPGSNRLMALAPLKVSDLGGRVVLQFTFAGAELASLGVPRFGERQARFVDEGESSGGRRCIDGIVFHDRLSRGEWRKYENTRHNYTIAVAPYWEVKAYNRDTVEILSPEPGLADLHLYYLGSTILSLEGYGNKIWKEREADPDRAYKLISRSGGGGTTRYGRVRLVLEAQSGAENCVAVVSELIIILKPEQEVFHLKSEVCQHAVHQYEVALEKMLKSFFILP